MGRRAADPPPGAKVAVLEGDPSKPGYFAMRLKTPDGYKIMPHWHPNVERITVISGTLHMGRGDTFTETGAHAMTAGSYGTMQPRVHHYAWTEGETELQITTLGPWKLVYVNPADDPSKGIEEITRGRATGTRVGLQLPRFHLLRRGSSNEGRWHVKRNRVVAAARDRRTKASRTLPDVRPGIAVFDAILEPHEAEELPAFDLLRVRPRSVRGRNSLRGVDEQPTAEARRTRPAIPAESAPHDRVGGRLADRDRGEAVGGRIGAGHVSNNSCHESAPRAVAAVPAA